MQFVKKNIDFKLKSIKIEAYNHYVVTQKQKEESWTTLNFQTSNANDLFVGIPTTYRMQKKIEDVIYPPASHPTLEIEENEEDENESSQEGSSQSNGATMASKYKGFFIEASFSCIIRTFTTKFAFYQGSMS